MTNAPTSAGSDLLVRLAADRLTLVALHPESPRALVSVPISDRSPMSVAIRVFTGLLRTSHPRRLVVSLAADVNHETRVVPFVDALDNERARQGFSVVWLPSIEAIVAAVANAEDRAATSEAQTDQPDSSSLTL